VLGALAIMLGAPSNTQEQIERKRMDWEKKSERLRERKQRTEKKKKRIK